MATYTVILDDQQEIALQYALDLALAAQPPVEEGQEPPPAPTLETMPQWLVNADLANRLRDLESLLKQTEAVLGVIDAATIPQPTLRAYALARKEA
jgi:hypothetical protein